METDSAAIVLTTIIKAFVEKPDDVKVSRKVDEMGVLLTLDVNPLDMGKVIGRSGATAQAIRTILRIVGMKHGARINMLITDPRRGVTTHASDAVDADLKGI